MEEKPRLPKTICRIHRVVGISRIASARMYNAGEFSSVNDWQGLGLVCEKPDGSVYYENFWIDDKSIKSIRFIDEGPEEIDLEDNGNGHYYCTQLRLRRSSLT